MPDGDAALAAAGVAAGGTVAEAKQAAEAEQPDPDLLVNPDMSVLRLGRRDPPAFPLDVLGSAWVDWSTATARAAACQVHFVVAPLLTSASALIGHARRAQAVPGGRNAAFVGLGGGDSGDGKSPGADEVLGKVIPELTSGACWVISLIAWQSGGSPPKYTPRPPARGHYPARATSPRRRR